MCRLAGPLVCAVMLATGCGGDSSTSFKSVSARAPAPMAAKMAAAGEADPEPAKKADDARAKADDARARKIIYTVRVELIVEEFDEASNGLLELLTAHEGYVARSETTGRPNEPRRGSWTLRVPVARYEAFLKSLVRLGELRRSTRDSEDITDRYFDLAADMANLEVREKALRAMLDDKKLTGKNLKDLLEVDRELSNVRGQINQRKGQLQRWDKETAFATITVEMQDRKSYTPPTSPDFGTSVERTFHTSIDALVKTGKGLVLAAVAVGPWLGVLLVAVVPVVLLHRIRRRGAPPPAPVVEPPPGPVG